MVKVENSSGAFVVLLSHASKPSYGVITSRSYHTNGVNVLMMDGSVRFVSNSVQLSAWRAAGTRNGGETIPLD